MFRFFNVVIIAFALMLEINIARADCPTGYTAVTLDPDRRGTKITYDASAGTWTVNFDYGDVSGISTCNSTSGLYWTAYPQYNFEQGTSGANCWCKMTSPARSAWVCNVVSDSDCAARCASYCAADARFDAEFREVVFGSITEDICTANTISINWKNATGGTMESNSCTYGGTLTTPATAPTKRGHTFTGWSYQ